MSIQQQVQAVRARMAAAAESSGRRPEDIALCAATKVQSDDTIRAAIAAGIRKINYFSYMSNAGVRAVEALIAEQHPKYFHALANAATKAMQADAESAMEMFSMK